MTAGHSMRTRKRQTPLRVAATMRTAGRQPGRSLIGHVRGRRPAGSLVTPGSNQWDDGEGEGRDPSRGGET